MDQIPYLVKNLLSTSEEYTFAFLFRNSSKTCLFFNKVSCFFDSKSNKFYVKGYLSPNPSGISVNAVVAGLRKTGTNLAKLTMLS